jgi:Restriction endonuclease EcoRV
MTEIQKNAIKCDFLENLQAFATTLAEYVSTEDNQWTIKGFIDVFERIYTISNDTKIVSKVLEIQLFAKFLEFSEQYGYDLVLAEKQNWYPDISLVSKTNPSIKFALDLKTTYRLDDKPDFCNGFTLGSHGAYFTDRSSHKNIQFPYSDYLGHYCLGIIYSRNSVDIIDETKTFPIEKLSQIPSVIHNFTFFACEKWTIASDKGGSGNTANIGSISNIADIMSGNGIFKHLGEAWFDDYWMNFGKITTKDSDGNTKKITALKDFLKYKGADENLVNAKTSKKGGRDGR